MEIIKAFLTIFIPMISALFILIVIPVWALTKFFKADFSPKAQQSQLSSEPQEESVSSPLGWSLLFKGGLLWPLIRFLKAQQSQLSSEPQEESVSSPLGWSYGGFNLKVFYSAIFIDFIAWNLIIFQNDKPYDGWMILAIILSFISAVLGFKIKSGIMTMVGITSVILFVQLAEKNKEILNL